MEVINNIDKRLGDDLRSTMHRDAKVSIAAAYFSIYAYEALKSELERIKELRFIFTSPAFIADQFPKEKREFYIPKLSREKSLYGTELEIRLKNELSQKAIARECTEWIRGKARFRTNITSGAMQGFINVQHGCFLQAKNACICNGRSNGPGSAFLLLATSHKRMANPVTWTVKNNEMTVVH